MNYGEEIAYKKGYFKALLDTKGWIDANEDTLHHFKYYTKKKFPLLLEAFLVNREELMKYGVDAEMTLRETKK